MKEKQILFQNTSIHYKTTDNGFPVILLHGFAEDSDVWNNQVDFLKDEYNLIIPDLPGSGRSALIEGDAVGLEVYAECVKQILDEEKIRECIMIGHSMGGYITLAFAEKFQGTLTGLGLFHSSAYADDEAKIETRTKAIGFIETNGPLAFLRTSIPGLFYADHPSGHAEVARRIYALIEKGKAFSAKALIQYYRAMIARPARTNILKNMAVPVLFIAGEHDKAVPFKHSLEQSHMPSRSYINILRNSAHMGMQEEAGRSNEFLANFLQTVQTKTK